MLVGSLVNTLAKSSEKMLAKSWCTCKHWAHVHSNGKHGVNVVHMVYCHGKHGVHVGGGICWLIY